MNIEHSENTREFDYWIRLVNSRADIQDSQGQPMKRKGDRNGVVVAQQVFRVIPDKDLALRFKKILMDTYNNGLGFKMEAWRWVHNLNGKTLQSVLYKYEQPFVDYFKERKLAKKKGNRFFRDKMLGGIPNEIKTRSSS